jgi:hypothetical protein
VGIPDSVEVEVRHQDGYTGARVLDGELGRPVEVESPNRALQDAHDILGDPGHQGGGPGAHAQAGDEASGLVA